MMLFSESQQQVVRPAEKGILFDTLFQQWQILFVCRPDSSGGIVASQTDQLESRGAVDEAFTEISQRMVGTPDRVPVGFHIFMCVIKTLFFEIFDKNQ